MLHVKTWCIIDLNEINYPQQPSRNDWR